MASCRMAMGERPNAGRAVSMVANEPTTMIDIPHEKSCH